MSFVLIAEGVEKPGNIGTLIRTADASGVHAVILIQFQNRSIKSQCYSRKHGKPISITRNRMHN